jgi:hypothetical protein
VDPLAEGAVSSGRTVEVDSGQMPENAAGAGDHALVVHMVLSPVLTQDAVQPIDSSRDQRLLVELYLMPIMQTLKP